MPLTVVGRRMLDTAHSYTAPVALVRSGQHPPRTRGSFSLIVTVLRLPYERYGSKTFWNDFEEERKKKFLLRECNVLCALPSPFGNIGVRLCT